MKRLCRDSSRPYLGRSAPSATSTVHGNVKRDGAEVSRGHSNGASGSPRSKRGKASEALPRRKAEPTDRPSRNDPPRRPKLKAAGQPPNVRVRL